MPIINSSPPLRPTLLCSLAALCVVNLAVGTAASQTSLAPPGNFSATATAAPQAGPAFPPHDPFPSGSGTFPEEGAVSWKLLAPNLLHDQKNIWLFPAHVAKGEHWKPALGFVVATAGLVALDPFEAPYFRSTSTYHTFNQAFSGGNTSMGTTIVPTAFYAVSLVRHNKYDQHTSLLVGEAVLDSELLTELMKSVDRRLRPADVPLQGNFSDTFFDGKGGLPSGRGSFPSGHTIAAFSIATVFANRYPRHRWVPWVAYGLAGLVAFSRVTLQSHFTSDVFAGAVLGYSISHYVVLQQ